MDTTKILRVKLLILKGGSSSVVERQLPKLNVAGSIPVSRSNKNKRLTARNQLIAASSGTLNSF